jgi:hypothetical protein
MLRLRDALLAAYRRAALEQMLLYGMGQQLEQVAADENLSQQVTEVIDWANRSGKASLLMEQALAHKPDNAILRDAVETIRREAANVAPPQSPYTNSGDRGTDAPGATFTTTVSGNASIRNIVNIDNLEGDLNLG